MSTTGSTVFTARGIAAGARALGPISLFVVPFGLSFGVAALGEGLEPAIVILMSLFVFAGSAQFAVLELWTAPLPLLTITLTVLAVNARHLVYGMALAPWLLQVESFPRLVSLGLLTDLNYAHTFPSDERAGIDVGFLLGGGIAVWLAWVTGTALGVVLGSGIGDPARFGMDVVMVAYFAPIVVGFWDGRRSLHPWCATAATAAGATYILPVGWPVVVAAVVGALIGMMQDGD